MSLVLVNDCTNALSAPLVLFGDTTYLPTPKLAIDRGTEGRRRISRTWDEVRRRTDLDDAGGVPRGLPVPDHHHLRGQLLAGDGARRRGRGGRHGSRWVLVLVAAPRVLHPTVPFILDLV